MLNRTQALSLTHNFFLFGARGTGKTTLLKALFSTKNTLWINFLSFQDEDRFSHHPDLLTELLAEKAYKRVIIDEVQKVPKILDIVHLETENNKDIQFILTGSSARKLKRGGANLLAGRMFTFTLHPLTYKELGKLFQMEATLQTGSLPALINYKTLKEKSRYLDSYIQTYLKEEILIEQIIRKTRPFREFLEVSAQCSGQIINYSHIARQLKVDYTTVRNYFEILSDTYLGFFLKSFHRSIRKQQSQSPKFFLFDTGIKRALLKQTSIPLRAGSYEYGKAFEHFIILELLRLNAYYETHYTFSYLRDKNNQEVDIIIQKPNGHEILVEVKSSTSTDLSDGKVLEKFLKAWDRPCQAQVWSQDIRSRKISSVFHYHWRVALEKLFDPNFPS